MFASSGDRASDLSPRRSRALAVRLLPLHEHPDVRAVFAMLDYLASEVI